MKMNEIIIVGSRYGELASVVKPLYAMMTPVTQTDIKEKLGGDVVYLSPTDNQFDDDAVGVFTVSQQLLGYVWMYQSYGLKQMLKNSGKRYVKAQISRMNTTFGLLMATSDGSWTLDANVQDNTIDAPTWAVDLPEVLTSMTSQSLTLGIDKMNADAKLSFTSKTKAMVKNLTGSDATEDNGGGNSGSSENSGNSGNSGTLAAPTISGNTSFSESTQVSISGPDGAAIHYTTDGSTPTAESTVYSEAITLSATTTVKAIAIKNGVSSEVASRVFTKSSNDDGMGQD